MEILLVMLHCNLAKQAKMPPRELAEMLLANIPEDPIVAKIEIAGPGFLNFYIQENLHGEVLNTILQHKLTMA